MLGSPASGRQGAASRRSAQFTSLPFFGPPTLEQHIDNQANHQLQAAGALKELPSELVPSIDSFLNTNSSRQLSRTCKLMAPPHSIVRQCRYPTLEEIRDMIRDPQGRGKMLGIYDVEVQLPAMINDQELTSLINQGVLSKVKKLNLSNCTNISNTAFALLGNCTSLTSINLDGCQINNDGLSRL